MVVVRKGGEGRRGDKGVGEGTMGAILFVLILFFVLLEANTNLDVRYCRKEAGRRIGCHVLARH